MADDRTVLFMPFGQYKGRLILDLPDDYLGWLLTIDLRPPLRRAVEWVATQRAERRDADRQRQERRRRAHDPPSYQQTRPAPAMVDELISVGLRTLARRYHPDAGGTHEQMIQATAAADWLRDVARGLPA